MRQVAEHIKMIEPEWTRFRSAHSGFDLVEFWSDTRNDGSFGVRGYLVLDSQAAELLAFIANSHPPRPLYTNRLIVDPVMFAFRHSTNSEPIDAGNSRHASH